MKWKIRDRSLDLSHKTLIMGIVNVTPDSFSDGGSFLAADAAVYHAKRMVEEGADLLDLGGESSRPGAEPVSAAEEWNRIHPVLDRLLREVTVPISIDTYKAETARKALEVGAVIINDITGMTGDPEMMGTVKKAGAGVVIMHMQGAPRTMQEHPVYVDVVKEVTEWLENRMTVAEEAGISPEHVVLDPGIGFGKTFEHNLQLMANLDQLAEMGRPILVGPSRKAFIGKILDLPVEDRIEGTAAAVALAVWQGAKIVRIHDVKAMTRVVRVVEAIQKFKI